jgi:hypothetical protein
MRQFRNIVEQWFRRIFGRPPEAVPAIEAEWFAESGGHEADRAFAWHGIEDHEWEEFES